MTEKLHFYWNWTSILTFGHFFAVSTHSVLVRFRENKYGVSADIRKFYNMLKLDPSHYKYLMAMWRPNMSPDEEAEEWY